ncbi:MAG: hypothetical protein QME06_04780 [Desulfobacterales bacterium]|nr:hypothetical protein [Desulfobacterales bacterium]
MTTTAFKKEVKESKEKGDRPTIVRGIVVSMDWDEKGNALAAAISTPDEQEYVIKQDEKGKELLKFIRHDVEVYGVVRKAIKGRNMVTVKSYKLKIDDY